MPRLYILSLIQSIPPLQFENLRGEQALLGSQVASSQRRLRTVLNAPFVPRIKCLITLLDGVSVFVEDNRERQTDSGDGSPGNTRRATLGAGPPSATQ